MYKEWPVDPLHWLTMGPMKTTLVSIQNTRAPLLSGVPDYFGRNKISSGGDLSHYSSASLY